MSVEWETIEDMGVEWETIKSVDLDPSGVATLRAVRPDGNVLIKEQRTNQSLGSFMYGYMVHSYGTGFAVGEYEWQQLVSEEWVVLSRLKVAE